MFQMLLQQNITVIVFVPANQDNMSKTISCILNINNWFIVFKCLKTAKTTITKKFV